MLFGSSLHKAILSYSRALRALPSPSSNGLAISPTLLSAGLQGPPPSPPRMYTKQRPLNTCWPADSCPWERGFPSPSEPAPGLGSLFPHLNTTTGWLVSWLLWALPMHTSFNIQPRLGDSPLALEATGVFGLSSSIPWVKAQESCPHVLHLEERGPLSPPKLALKEPHHWSPAVEAGTGLGLGQDSTSLIILNARQTRPSSWAGFSFPWQRVLRHFFERFLCLSHQQPAGSWRPCDPCERLPHQWCQVIFGG